MDPRCLDELVDGDALAGAAVSAQDWDRVAWHRVCAWSYRHWIFGYWCPWYTKSQVCDRSTNIQIFGACINRLFFGAWVAIGALLLPTIAYYYISGGKETSAETYRYTKEYWREIPAKLL